MAVDMDSIELVVIVRLIFQKSKVKLGRVGSRR